MFVVQDIDKENIDLYIIRESVINRDFKIALAILKI